MNEQWAIQEGLTRIVFGLVGTYLLVASILLGIAMHDVEKRLAAVEQYIRKREEPVQQSAKKSDEPKQ